MRITTLCILFLILVRCDFRSSPQELEDINYSKYLSKPVSCLLNDLSESHRECIFFDEPPCFLQGAYFCYSDSIELKVFVNEYRFVKQFDTTMIWDYNGFLKEEIYAIKVSKNNKVINIFDLSRSDM